MRAVQITAINQMGVAQVADPVPAPGEALVRVRAAALNHRDVWIRAGQYAGLKFPCIPGSDGSGVVESVAGAAGQEWAGREVIINPAFDWGSNPHAQGAQFSILGLPRDGTLADLVTVPIAQLAPKPAHLTWEQAAALPLAGVTAWRALMTRGRFAAGDRVLITGIGSGVALFALQFAVAQKAEVWVTSSSEAKIAEAVKLGARGGFLYPQAGWEKAATTQTGGFDLIIESAGGPGFNDLLDAAAAGGRIVFFGATRGNAPEVVLRKVFWRQLSLLGTTMGNPADWREMTAFVDRAKIVPVVNEIFTLDRAQSAFDLMERGGQFGKIVVQIDPAAR